MKKKNHVVVLLIALCLVVIGGFAAVKAFADDTNQTICKGIFINTVDVGGMTGEEARTAVTEYIQDINKRKVTILVDNNVVETTVSSFGYTWQIDDVIEQALNFGSSGNFIKRYKEIKDLENENLILPLEAKVDKTLATSFVEENCAIYNILPVDATLSREGGQFVVTQHVVGRKVMVEDTVEKITNAMLNDWNHEDLVVEAVVMDDEPLYTSEKLALCKDILGTFSTTYSSSSASRANNLANGARLINGTILWPGETFSTGKALSPITVENGYSIAGAYLNGQVIDSVGGGVCQVATTLYNAILKSELDVKERSNHSMIVGYVKPSMDAAIAGDYKDLKFTNNSDVPVYIEATTAGRTITFTIYGHETRDTDNRTVKYESKVLEVIQPGKDKITEDDTQPVTYKEVTQEAHVGYKAELWKIVYVNGEEVSRDRVNYSSYAPEPAYITVGTKEVEEDPLAEESPAPSEKPGKSPKPTITPTPTPEPTPTEPDPTDEGYDDLDEEIFE